MGWVRNTSAEVASRSRYPLVISVCATSTALIILVIVLRGYHCLHINDRGRRSFYALCLSVASVIVYNTLAVLETRLGLGLPLVIVSEINEERYILLEFVGRLMDILARAGYNLALSFTALEYLANANLPTYHRIIWLAISVIALAHISSFLVLLLHCRPIKKVWIPTTEGRCFAAGSLLYGTSGATLACNLVAIILPIRKLCSLRLGRAKQVSIVGYNLLGLLTPVCSVIRICQINTMLENGDPTMFVVWGVAEICVGIITSSLPALSTLPRNFSISTLGKGSRPSATPTHVNIGLAPLTPPRSPDRASDKINLIKPGEVCSKGRKGGHDLDDDAQSVATSNVSSSWDAARLEQDL